TPTDEIQEEVPEAIDEKNSLMGDNSINESRNEDTPTDEIQEEVPEAIDEKNSLMGDNSINESRNEDTPTDEIQEEVPEAIDEKNSLMGDNSINESRNEDTPTDENQEEVPEDADEKNGLIDDNSINESGNEVEVIDEENMVDAHKQQDVVERRHFNILTRLLMGVGAECLRKYFLTIHPTWSNKPSDASTLKKGVLELQTEEETIFNTGNIEKWDVSLLFRVLRFSAVSSVELKLNPDKKVALCSIREIRNKIFAHAANEKVNDSDFKMLWGDLKCNLLVIGGSEEDINETLIDDTELVAEQYKDLLFEEMSRRRYEVENIGSQNVFRNASEETPLQNQPTVPLWDDWMKFLECMNSFNSVQTHFVLVADEMTHINLQNFKVLSAIPWKMVIDFNPSSEDDGLYKAFSNQSNLQRILSPFTPSEIKKAGYEGLPKQIDSKRTQWLFANGRKEDTEDSKPRPFPVWRKQSKKHISSLFYCCSQSNKFDNQKSIICLLLPTSKSTESFMEETLNLFSEHFSDFNPTFVSIDGSYKKLDISPRIREFPLSSEVLKNGLDNLFKHSENAEGYQVPASLAELRICLSTREYIYMEELLELFYIGCQNEFINLEDEEEDQKENEEEHRVSFLSGNIISFLSLYFNHDAKREVEKDIEIHILRLLNQALKHSVIVQIAHPPGTGGSTITRRVLWNIHKNFPCASVRLPNQFEFDEDPNFIDELCNRIVFLEDRCNIPPVILLDGHRHWRVHAFSNRIVRTLNSRGKHAVVLECIRSVNCESKSFKQPNADIHKVFVVDARLENSPADLEELKNKYQQSNRFARRVFHFPLLSMVEEFRENLIRIVSTSLDELNNVEYEIAAFVAFLQLYGEVSTPARLLYEAFQSHLSISVCEQVTYESVKNCFSNNLLNLMVIQRKTGSKIRKSKDNDGYFPSYTLQHHVVAELVFKKYLDDKKINLYKFVLHFLEYNISSIEKFLDLYCDIFLFNKFGNRDLKFSFLIEKLRNDNQEEAAIILDKAAKKIPDPRVYGHAARFCAKMKPPRFEKAETLIEAAVKLSESKGRVKSIQDGKGVVLSLELRHKIRNKKVESIEQLEELAQKALTAFNAARDFPPTFHSPLLGEVEVWLSCIQWITNHYCSGDAAEAVRFITTQSPPFFRTCIGDCFTLLDIVDNIQGASTTVSDPDEIRLRWDRARENMIKATSFKNRIPAGTHGGGRYDPLFGVHSKKSLPVFTPKESKRVKARLLLSSFYQDPRSFQSENKEDLVRFLEEMVVIERDYSFARHFFQLCSQIVGPRSYTLDQCWKVCQVWLQQPDSFDPLRYYYSMIIAFIQILNGLGPSGYFAEFKYLVQKLKEESSNNSKRNQSMHYLQKRNDANRMSQLISHHALIGDSAYKTDSAEAVRHFWTVESRRRLMECTGRLRVKLRGNKEVATIELLEGGVELYVGKSAETGTPGRDFDKDAKVYFVVSFTLRGPVANGITFQSMKPT
ncbi:Hypothetical predicted protein, partial [Paramuricea clavata]